MPSEMRSRSGSTASTTASTSSPFLKLRTRSSPVRLPRDVGQVHEAIDAAVQTDEDAEVGDRLDLAGHLVVLLVDRGERFPRIGAGLLDAERNAATLFIDVEHHDFDFVADLHDLGRIDVLVGPVHLRNVHQAFDARLELDEAAVIGDVGDLAEQARAGRVTTRDVDPRIFAELLEAERDAVALAVELSTRTSSSSPTLTTSDG